MDSKRKKIYIAAIILSLVACAGVLWWSGILGGGDSADPGLAAVPIRTTPKASDGTFTTPALFPDNPKLDTSVFDLSMFKSLKSYSTPTLTETEIGREDPFKGY